MNEISSTDVQRTFSMYGLSIQKDTSVYLQKCLQRVKPEDRDTWLTTIIDTVFEENPGTPHVSIETIKKTIELSRSSTNLQASETVFNVINALQIPKIVYDVSKQKFLIQKIDTDLFPEAVHKSLMFQRRLELLWYRTQRNELFTPLKYGEVQSDKFVLTPIEYLLSKLTTGYVYVMGLLSQLREGQYYLEDTGGAVKINLKNANFQADFITEGSIVIANGFYKRGVVYVKDIGFPPSESSKDSRAAFADANTFGGPYSKSLKNSQKLKAHERSEVNEMIVFISDFWVDKPIVFLNFETILEGYKRQPPFAFVLCGQFLSFPLNVSSARKLKDGFDKLAELIQRYPEIQNYSQFVFVPGPHDLGAPKILPREPLPKSVMQDFMKHIPKTVLATNPCRIQYCTKEIVVLREDVVMKLCRNTLKLPTDREFSKHYAKSIICQSHLIPMSLPVTPIYWKHDHALQLFPTPDLIVVADQFENYSTEYENCKVINPGSFSKNVFKVYIPGTDEIEDCEVPDNTEFLSRYM